MKDLPKAVNDWNERYVTENTPWRHNEAHGTIINLVEQYTNNGANVLEVGCGTGEEAIAIAQLGYPILAIDLAERAIDIAKKSAERKESKAEFKVMDFLEANQNLDHYSTIVDVACLHTFKNLEGRKIFSNHVAKYLHDDGIWINLSCTMPAVHIIAEATSVDSPPTLTLMELAEATADHFQLLELQSTVIPVKRSEQPLVEFPAWVSVFKKS